MSSKLQSILDRLKVQLDTMSPEEYQEQCELIDQMNVGPSADELIRSFYELHFNYTTVFQFKNDFKFKAVDMEFPISGKDYSLAA